MRIVVALALVASLACSKAEPKKSAAAAGPAPVTAGTVAADGTRSIPIQVKKAGYEPGALTAKPNEKLVLVFTRVEDTECGAQVRLEGGPLHDLPLGKPVEVAVTAPPSGQIKFACGMDMMSGVVVVGS